MILSTSCWQATRANLDCSFFDAFPLFNGVSGSASCLRYDALWYAVSKMPSFPADILLSRWHSDRSMRDARFRTMSTSLQAAQAAVGIVGRAISTRASAPSAASIQHLRLSQVPETYNS